MLKRNKTPMLKKEDKQLNWLVFDAENKTLGRLASEIAKVLRGKHKPSYTPHVDCGDGVIVINAEKVHVTGTKRARKLYRHYTGWIGGYREVPFNTMMARNPTYALEHAVKGMMPHGRLSDAQLKKLRIYAGKEHDLEAQKPIMVNA